MPFCMKVEPLTQDRFPDFVRLIRALAEYESLPAPPVFWPNVLGLRADACRLAGRSAEAIDVLDQAIALAGLT